MLLVEFNELKAISISIFAFHFELQTTFHFLLHLFSPLSSRMNSSLHLLFPNPPPLLYLNNPCCSFDTNCLATNEYSKRTDGWYRYF